MKRVDWLSAAAVLSAITIAAVALFVEPPLSRAFAVGVLLAVVPVAAWVWRDSRRANCDLRALRESPWSPK